MKKIVLVGLMVMLLGGCGKIEKGVMTIENKSTHVVNIEFAQNYSSELITLQSGDSINRPWERYFHCIIQNPSMNILKKQQTKEKITISNNDKLYTYEVTNGIPDLPILKILDETKSILAMHDGTPTDSITLDKVQSTINTFIPLSIKNMIFDKGISFDIDGHTYYQIEKIGELYYFNKKTSAGLLDRKIININFIDNKIIITTN